MHAMNTASLSDILPLSIFRAYDIRGIVDETLTEPGVFLIGKALGTLVLEQNETAITIARDGRFSGARLAQALSDGILSTGCNVIDIGMVPTPILYYATHLLPHHSGIMITGSHNPPEYNGLKIVINGVSLADLALQKLHQRIVDQQFVQGHGKLETLDIAESYLDNVTQRIQVTRPLRIVLDAGNGVAGLIAPTLFRRLGCDVDELYCDVDGNFPNHHPDPSQSKNLSDLVRVVAEKNADIGLAFDGDGDRLGVVTNLGEIICPDRLLMLFAEGILADEPQAKIIYDVKCTHHLDAHIRTLGGEPLMWKTGHSFIKAKLNETQALLAGEMSGHFFFKHRWHKSKRVIPFLHDFQKASIPMN
jgi:phosphomannomutase/phosphoglucomutase